MKLNIYQVDAFSSVPFSGNPAAVCLLDAKKLPMEDDTRQNIASEMNLAETAFVEPMDPAGSRPEVFQQANTFKLRWFTPTVEVPLCGHATLASAAVLYEEIGNTNSAIHFETLSGRLSVSRVRGTGATQKTRLEMVLPRLDITHSLPAFVVSDTAFLRAVVGDLEVAEIRFNDHVQYLMVVLSASTTREQLEEIVPDYQAMESTSGSNPIRGVIVTTAGDGEDYDVLSRFFAPWCGIPEDPVTGSAHSLLTPFWAEQLGRVDLRARQCSPRGGDLLLKDVPDKSTVTVSGYSTIVLRGELTF